MYHILQELVVTSVKVVVGIAKELVRDSLGVRDKGVCVGLPSLR